MDVARYSRFSQQISALCHPVKCRTQITIQQTLLAAENALVTEKYYSSYGAFSG